MLRTIEHHNGSAIQKITKSDGSLVRYQTVALSSVGDTSAVTPHSTLTAARAAVGATVAPSAAKVIVPKSSYAQNTKGYRADARR